MGPFHLGIDQQDRIWVTNGSRRTCTRFPAADPSKAEKFKTGYSGSGLAIDSRGNVWVTEPVRQCGSWAWSHLSRTSRCTLKLGWQR